MKYLRSRLVMSAALAIAASTWAQAQTPPPTHRGHHTTTHHHVVRPRPYSWADRLNAEELADLQRRGPPTQRMPSGGKQLTDPR
jgi:hypothetical protein